MPEPMRVIARSAPVQSQTKMRLFRRLEPIALDIRILPGTRRRLLHRDDSARLRRLAP